ncbi:MAG: hypothetical protein Q9217_001892 [Psora testacea]
MSASLRELPQEVLTQIFLQVNPEAIPNLQEACRSFHDLCGPLIWRHCCQTKYQYWSTSRRVEEKLAEEVGKNDWKQIYAERHKIDRDISRAINSILASQVRRIEKTKGIVKFGYDAKDMLLQHLTSSDSAKDVLARRVAIEQWEKVRRKEYVPLEKALGAFDMFVMHDAKGDIDDISSNLDRIAKRLREEHPDFSELSTRRKAIAVAKYVRARNLVGVNANVDIHYHDLQNNFIGIALAADDHPSLPLVSVAIYCCVARRMGIDASPCGFPFHVLAIIRAANGWTLDSHEPRSDSEPQSMYMDPFRTDTEISIDNLLTQLVSMGVPKQDHKKLLGIAQTSAIVARCARNIITSVQTLPPGPEATPFASPIPDIKSAFYAALWALVLLPNGDNERLSLMQQARYLPVVIKHIEAQFPTDAWMMEKNIIPAFETLERQRGIGDTLRAIRANDENLKKVKLRNTQASQSVRYRVGQVFQHKRYHYHAMIVGWDVECAASEHWMSQMRVRDLQRGKHQSFYHALVEDRSTRYVAEENIDIIEQEPIEGLMAIAGQYFKRWNPDTKTFVSNIKDEYPDD